MGFALQVHAANAGHLLKTEVEPRRAQEFLNAAYRAVRGRDAAHQLDKLISEIPADTDVEEFLAAFKREVWRAIGQRIAKEERRRQKLLNVMAACFAVGVALVGTVAYGRQPLLDFGAQVLGGTYTPTAPPIEPSATPMPTRPAPAGTPGPTALPVPTGKTTAIPTSGQLIAAGTVLVPAVDAENPGQQWLLANDAPSGASWTAVSSASAADVPGGYSYTELGNATVTWTMDVPLNAGAYQLFVLDTVQYSTGVQEYEVLLDGAPAVAAAGSNRVIFGGSAAYPQPAADWLSLGSYRVVQGQALSVRTTVGARSADAPFAAGPILMTTLSGQQLERIAMLAGQGIVASVLDDSRAAFYPMGMGAQPLSADLQGTLLTDPLAWNGRFRSLDLSGDKWQPGWTGRGLRADWRPAGRLQSGRYALYARIPQLHASAAARYDLIADGQVIDNGQENAVEQGELNGQWAPVGTWFLPREAALGVRMIIALENNPAQREIGLDAVVLVRLPD